VKYKFLWLIVPILLSAAVAVLGVHYSTKQIIEVSLCGGGYIPIDEAGNLCEGEAPNRIVNQKSNLEDYSFAAAALILLSGIFIALRADRKVV
jgi:hypothetical protein